VTPAAVATLHARYGALLDDGPIEEWPALFTDVCFYRVVSADDHDRGLPLGLIRCESRAMLCDRIRAVQELSMYVPRRLRHVVGYPIVSAAPDGAAWRSTAAFAVYQALPGEPLETLVVGRYLDEIVDDGDALRFRTREVVYDNALIPNSIVMPI